MRVIKVNQNPPSIQLGLNPPDWKSMYKALAVLMALCPPSTQRLRKATARLQTICPDTVSALEAIQIALEVGVIAGGAIRDGKALLAAWPEDVELEGEKYAETDPDTDYRDPPEQFLRSIAQIVHQAYHQDMPGTWRECPRGVCGSIRQYLGEKAEVRA